ncbi:unnamed protein product [Anisakis simplex]|uniref:Aa_trans domain-containing protein n=1 Tax=Anisakis simplex TaxID=6269 RepID=A0A0M3JY45_ANISI|nr:unnamed protein product [Anisakis simplex]
MYLQEWKKEGRGTGPGHQVEEFREARAGRGTESSGDEDGGRRLAVWEPRKSVLQQFAAGLGGIIIYAPLFGVGSVGQRGVAVNNRTIATRIGWPFIV